MHDLVRVGRLALGSGLVGLLLGAGGAGPEGGAKASGRPRLVLALAVDQMRFDYLTRFGPLFKGGFRRLLDRGAVFTNARYGHACLTTGPGHSVMLSGRHPRHSGIVDNSWYDPALGREVNVVEDPVQAPLGGKGLGASPASFLGFTLGDALKRESPSSRVVGISMKDRAAILMTGRRADAAYWYERAGGHFITSTYYMATTPRWLEAWNRARHPDRYAGQAWNRLLPDPELYRKYAGEDAVEGESDRKDITFPHRFRSAPPADRFYDELRATPFMDELTLEAALAAMSSHELGRRGVTDLLAISFSATDVIGHTYGPDSQELMDQILRLDLLLQRLFEEVDRRVGLERTLVVLTADHGVLPLVEVLRSRGIPARRAKPGALVAAVDEALRARFPAATGLVAAAEPPDFVLDLPALERQGLKRAEVEAVVEKALLGTGLVDAVYTHARLLGDPPADDPYFALYRNGFFAPRSPHLIGRLKEYVYLDDRPGGTGHGTPYEYDRHVPIVFMGAGIAAGRHNEACGPEDIAYTLGKLLGLDYPKQDASRALLEPGAR